MVKRRGYDICAVILTLCIFLVPLFGSGAEKKTVIYASLFVCLAALAYTVYKEGRIYVTKTALFFFVTAAYCALQLTWVSDKGSQITLLCMFLTGGVASLCSCYVKTLMAKDSYRKAACAIVYLGAVFYSLMALLHQLFIENTFFAGNMDFSSGNASLSAIIALTGIISGLKLFYGRDKNTEFYVSLVLMGLVFILSKSLMIFFAGTLMLLLFTLNIRHKRTEAFFALVAVVVTGIINIIYCVYALVAGKVHFEGALRGLVSVVGLGSEGYNASYAVLDKAYEGYVHTFAYLTEAFGVFGIAIMAAAIWAAFYNYKKRPSFRNMLLCAAVFAGIFASSETMYVTLLFTGMYLAAKEEGNEIPLNPYSYLAAAVPMVICGVLLYARVCYMIGDGLYDAEKYSRAQMMYEMGAKAERVNSEGWEKAYVSAYKAEENGAETKKEQKEYLEKAYSVNKKNYRYRALLADTFAREGDYRQALLIWDSIVTRYDVEYLYPEYTKRIKDVMEFSDPDLQEMDMLYQKITFYGQKSRDKDIKLEVNNTLDEAQRFYLECRDGDDYVVDMFPIYEYEEETDTDIDLAEGDI